MSIISAATVAASEVAAAQAWQKEFDKANQQRQQEMKEERNLYLEIRSRPLPAIPESKPPGLIWGFILGLLCGGGH